MKRICYVSFVSSSLVRVSCLLKITYGAFKNKVYKPEQLHLPNSMHDSNECEIYIYKFVLLLK